MNDRIERFRKGAFEIVVTRGGRPVTDAKVKVQQVEHDFKFGCAIPTRRELGRTAARMRR